MQRATNFPKLHDLNDFPRDLPVTSSTAIFLVAWFTGTTGFLLSILAVILHWFLPSPPAEPTLSPAHSLPIRPLVDSKVSPLKPISVSSSSSTTQSRCNTNRHVSFSLEPGPKSPKPFQKGILIPMPCIESLPASSSDSVTLVSPSCSDDLPPLDNMPPLPFESNRVEFIVPMKSKPPLGLGPPPISFNPFKSRRWSSSLPPRVTSDSHSDHELLLPSSPDKIYRNGSRCSSLKGENRRLPFASRFSPRDRSASISPRATASAPTTPMLPHSVLKPAGQVSHRASANVSAIDISSPVFSTPASGHSRRSLSKFINFGIPRSPSSPQQPLRTQPYGPPYNLPMPRPTSKSTHRKSSSTPNATLTKRRKDITCVDLT